MGVANEWAGLDMSTEAWPSCGRGLSPPSPSPPFSCQEVPGGRAVVTRVPVGVVGVAWSGPRPLRRALELLPPLLALGNAVVLLAPPPAVGPAQRLRKVENSPAPHVGPPPDPTQPPPYPPCDPPC